MSAAAAYVPRPCPNGTVERPSCKRRDCDVCGPRWAGDQKRVIGENLSHYANVVALQVPGELLLDGDPDSLARRQGPVAMIQITPPGIERLPWACKRRHQHAGPRGCRVEERAAREWCDSFTERLASIRRAGNAYVRRRICECGHTKRAHVGGACGCGCGCEKFKGFAPAFLVRVLEPQKRGVPHWHGVFGYTSEAERRALKLWVAWLRAQERCSCRRTLRWHNRGGHCEVEHHSPTFGWSHLRQYDFGDQTGTDHGIRPKTGAETTRYLSSYLTGRSKHKPNIRQNIVNPAMTYWAIRDAKHYVDAEGEMRPRRYALPMVWITPRLTSAKLGGTGVTMRALRRSRVVFAVLRGRYRDDNGNTQPEWFSNPHEVLPAVVVYRRTRRRSGKERRDPADDAGAARFVKQMLARFDAMEPGYPKLLFRRELLALVPSIAEPAPKLRLVHSVDQPELAAAA